MKDFNQGRVLAGKKTVRKSTPSIRIALVCILLIVLISTAFAPVLGNGFVEWDDSTNFVHNTFFRGLGWSQIRWAFTTAHIGVYQPLSWIFLESQFSIWKLNPFGYHFSSLIWHCLNSLALFILVIHLVRMVIPECRNDFRWRFFFSCGVPVALFAIHPLRVEAVAWASCQPYLPATFFSILSVLFYLKSRSPSRSGRIWVAVSLVYMCFAVLSKAIAMVLPFELVLLDTYLILREKSRRDGFKSELEFKFSTISVLAVFLKSFYSKMAFWALSILTLVMAGWARGTLHQPPKIEEVSLVERLLRACYAIALYCQKTLLPMGLSSFYPNLVTDDLLRPELVGSVFFVILLGVLAFRSWKRRLAVPFTLLASFGFIFPVLGLFRIGGVAAADRYTYLASLPFVVFFASIAACGVERGSKSILSRIGISLSAGLILLFGLLTNAQSKTWQNSKTLWLHAIQNGADESEVAHSNLGTALNAEGEWQAAAIEFRRAIQINPNYPLAYIGLGEVLRRLGQRAEAHSALIRGVSLDQQDANSLTHLGLSYLEMGDPAEARKCIQEALKLDPSSRDAVRVLVRIEFATGHFEAARQNNLMLLRTLSEETSEDADDHNTMGGILMRLGDLDGAALEFKRTFELRPGYSLAEMNMGDLLSQKGKFEEAHAHYVAARQLDPSLAAAHYKLGISLANQGRLEEAKVELEEALRLQINYPEAQFALDKVRKSLSSH